MECCAFKINAKINAQNPRHTTNHHATMTSSHRLATDPWTLDRVRRNRQRAREFRCWVSRARGLFGDREAMAHCFSDH